MATERERTIAARHREISEYVQRALTEADFQESVRESRRRMDREKAERDKKKKDAAAGGQAASPNK
jgi:hypothetical protein